MCGPTAQQTELGNAQLAFYQQLTQEYGQEFQENQAILGSLTSSFEPILKAGINQQGFSPAELQNLQSEATTGVGQSYASASQALAKAQGTEGGGAAFVPAGEKAQQEAQLATSAAQTVSGEQQQILAQDYATGRQNYLDAAGILGGVAGQESPTAFAGAATGAGSAAGTTQNQIAQEQSSWMQPVFGAIGALGGAGGQAGAAALGG